MSSKRFRAFLLANLLKVSKIVSSNYTIIIKITGFFYFEIFSAKTRDFKINRGSLATASGIGGIGATTVAYVAAGTVIVTTAAATAVAGFAGAGILGYAAYAFTNKDNILRYINESSIKSCIYYISEEDIKWFRGEIRTDLISYFDDIKREFDDVC